jgi:pimeloyl-ACP methyl ester carboxylesterase
MASTPRRNCRLLYWSKIIVFGLFVLLIEGCAPPVGIEPVDIQTAYQLNTVSALSARQPSEASKTVLRRNGLIDRFETEPAHVLTELHAGLNPKSDEDKLFALAELSLLHAENTQDQAYFLASAVYAWALLFPGDGEGVRLEASDPRLRLAYDFYNQGLAQGLATRDNDEPDELEVDLKPGNYKLPFGTLSITLDDTGLSWGGYQLRHFVSTSALKVRGLRNRYRTPGLGAALAVSISSKQDSKKVIGSDRLGPRTKVPVTAILQLGTARADLNRGHFKGQLALYASDQVTSIIIDGQKQTIESDPSAAFAFQLNDSPIYAMEIANFLSGGVFSGFIPKDRAQDGLFTLQPYRPGKIPLVLVHGTASSPVRWAELVNELEGDLRIRETYQIWAFVYDSGNTIAYSAGRLITALKNALQEFDPEGKDSALQRMVVVGHSQGGLLTKMTAINNDSLFWNLISNKPFDQIQVDPDTRALLQRSLFYKPLPFVNRVIFVATPHHGAMLAAYQWVTDLAAKFVTLPQTMLRGIAQAATSSGDEKLTAILRRPPTAIDNMNPNNPGLKILASIPVSPQITAHSIIAVEGDGPKEEGDDGVVAYQSAHIDEAVSEKVVRWGHSCQGQPEVIEEIRRILLEHLKTPAPY